MVAPRSPQISGAQQGSTAGGFGGNSIGDSPRNSLSQPDLKDLRQRARRFAQTLGNRGRAERREAVGAGVGGGGIVGGSMAGATSANVPGVADLSTGVVNSQHTVNTALRKLKESFKRISTGIHQDWTALEQAPELPEYSFEDIRSRVELNLSRIAFPQRYRSNARGQPSTQWEYTKAKLATLEKLDTWVGASVHPMAEEVGTFLWKALDVEFEYLTRPEVPFSHLDLFCTSLQELTTLLPSSLFQVPEKAILEDPDMEAVMGLIYADILALVASGAQEIILPSVPSQATFTALYNSGIRQTIKGRVHHHHLHFSHRHSLPQATSSSATSAPASGTDSNIRMLAGRPRVNTNNLNSSVAGSAVQSPTSPSAIYGSTVNPFRRTPSTTVWEQTLRTILEQVKYHSQLLQSELSELQALEQKGRFEAIESLLDQVDDARKAEDEARRAAKEVDDVLERFYGKDVELRPSVRDTAQLSDSSITSASSRSSSPDSEADRDDQTENAEGGSSVARNPDATKEELEQEKAELVKIYQTAKQTKRTVYGKLLDEAGHIKCDVCVFTAYDRVDRSGDDYSLDFSANIREFTSLMAGLEKASGSGAGGSGGSGEGKESVNRKSLLRLYVVNENSLSALKSIAPHYMLGKGRKMAMVEPNLWSFARSSAKVGWHFIETTFPNLEQGYGPEARIYSMKARDETAYFYDTTWKVYWAQPRPDVPNACPVAVLVLPEDDVPMSRPIDPTSPKSVRDFEKSRRQVAEMYKHLLYTPLKERGTIIVADDLAVQTLQETRRRWRIVLDKLRHFVDVLTDLLYVVASTGGDGTSNARGGRNTVGPKLDYNKAASQVFQILIKLNRYESMFIVTMSYLSQLADEEIFLSTADHNLLHDEYHTQHHHSHHNDAAPSRGRSTSTSGAGGPMMSSRHGTLNATSSLRRVSWRQVKKSQQDLMDTLKATKRQAESLKSIIDHQNSMRESRLANQHARIANRHAAEASRQADEAAKQTLSMRRMTILTFVFLPITFVAALFGVNVKEFGQGDLPIWLFFAIAIPFAAVVFGIWSVLEYWGQSTSSDGEGGELGKGMKVREEEMEAAMLKLDDEDAEGEGEEDAALVGFGGAGVGGLGAKGRGEMWEGGDRMV